MSAVTGVSATIRLYDRLFTVPNPAKSDDVLSVVNPDSLREVNAAVVEPSLVHAAVESVYQFEREGYFVADRYDHSPSQPVFNLTIGLRDSWGTAK